MRRPRPMTPPCVRRGGVSARAEKVDREGGPAHTRPGSAVHDAFQRAASDAASKRFTTTMNAPVSTRFSASENAATLTIGPAIP